MWTVDPPDDSTDESDKWDGRPECLNMIQALAINREFVTQTTDDYECVLRHFFPSLRLLVVLIDDAVAIDRAWNIKNNNFKKYESDWGDFAPRLEFTQKSAGPFTIVSDKNIWYKNYIQMDIEQRFKREEQDYQHHNAPALVVMGCRLPPDVKIPICGRYPYSQDKLQDMFPGIFSSSVHTGI